MGSDDGDTNRQKIVVGLVADPGTSTDLAEELCEQLPEQLATHVEGGVTWSVELASHMLYLDDSNQPTILDDGKTLQDRGWDMMVALTELPLRRNGEPLIFEVNIAERTAWVSIPAPGGLRLSALLCNTVVAVVHCMSEPEEWMAQVSDSAQEQHAQTSVPDPLRRVPGRDEQVENGSIRVGGGACP